MQTFTDWCASVGIRADGVSVEKIEQIGDTALGLQAVENIPENKTVVTVPRKTMMTWDDAVESSMLSKVNCCLTKRNLL